MTKQIILPLVLFLILILISGAFFIGHKLYKNIRDTKNSVELIQQEFKKKGDFIPPLFGGAHAEIRAFVIFNQSNQINHAYTLVLGDSIIESLLLDPKFLNGGIGGAGIEIAYHFLDHHLAFWTRKPERIILAIGVNDAAVSDSNPEYFLKWQKKLVDTIEKAKITSANIYVCTILPVEHDGTFGDTYFNPKAIEKFNGIIKDVAKTQHIHLLDTASIFSNVQQKYTLDGVHLNPFGQRLLNEYLNKVR